MECSSSESGSYLSDCNFLDAFFDRQGSKGSKDGSSPTRKVSNTEYSTNSEEEKNCSVTYEEPLSKEIEDGSVETDQAMTDNTDSWSNCGENSISNEDCVNDTPGKLISDSTKEENRERANKNEVTTQKEDNLLNLLAEQTLLRSNTAPVAAKRKYKLVRQNTVGTNMDPLATNTPALVTSTSTLTMKTPTLVTSTSTLTTNTSSLATNTPTVVTNTHTLATNTSSPTTNRASLATNTHTLATNTSTLATNTPSLATNTSSLTTNTSTLATNTPSLATNTSSLTTNTSTLATNTDTLHTDTSTLATNTSNLTTNTPTLATNTSTLATNTPSLATYTSSLTTNTSTPATNTDTLLTDTSTLATNTSNLTTNTPTLATNTSTLATNTPSLATYTSSLTTNTSILATNTDTLHTDTSTLATDTPAPAALTPKAPPHRKYSLRPYVDALSLRGSFIKGSSSLPEKEKQTKTKSPFGLRRRASFMLKRSSWRASHFRSKSQGASTTKNKWDRPDRKEDDTSSTVSRVEMVPESSPSAQESASQAAQEILISSPGSSKARQKKFHRHFKTVPPDEKVLNYYSCALVADILLQGHLYITRNYFAFYSNVFGYVTKLLIPTTSVLKVTKEKTAYIIPNAVGVTTEEDKHVFGSLLSRDNTYKLMVQVWNAALTPAVNTLPKPECIEERLKEELEEPILQDEESSLSGSESNLESKLISNSVEPPPKGNTQKMGLEVKSYHDMFSQTTSSGGSRAPFLTFLRGLPRPTLLLLISTGLLVLLFASATVLLYRIARLHHAPTDFSSRSMSEVHAYINSNLEHITKVRESLEKLSFLIEHGGKYHS